MTAPELLLHRDAEALTYAVAARLVTRLVDAQSNGRVASVALTGGRIAAAVYRTIAESPARSAVDWSLVDFWWSDERFLPQNDAERNETQAREALLKLIDPDPARVHPMPADIGQGAEQAAVDYAADLAKAAPPGDPLAVPVFDLVMLGVGPDGHVASLFPERPALHERDRSVVAVHGAPKPPPTRITVTMPVLSHAAEVWFVVSGEDKASAVRLALSGAGEMQIPAAGPKGRSRTLWLLDTAAAAEVPKNIRPPRI
jgi:6-phosphogluconolactonase